MKKSAYPGYIHSINHRNRIERELKNAGISRWGMWKLESRYLPHIIHENEYIGGIAYGHDPQNNSIMLVATDRRILILDKKPFYSNEDDVTYEVVLGVEYSSVGFSATVTLHTRLRDFKLRTLNLKAAAKFVHYIEIRSLEHRESGHYYD